VNGRAVFVVGYGNPMRGDDGVGQEVARALATGPPETAGLAGANIIWEHQLLPEMATDVYGACYCVFIDAAYDHRPAGTVTVRLLPRPRPTGEWAPRSPRRLGFAGCWQDLGPQALLELARDLHGEAPSGAVVGVTAEDTSPGFGLSPVVAAAVPRAVAAVRLAVAAGHPAVRLGHRPVGALAREGPRRA
jgi:hydrogenase maturation protease